MWVGGTLEHGPSCDAFPCAWAENWVRREAARLKQVLIIGCQLCKWQLNLLCHKAVDFIYIYNFFLINEVRCKEWKFASGYTNSWCLLISCLFKINYHQEPRFIYKRENSSLLRIPLIPNMWWVAPTSTKSLILQIPTKCPTVQF